MNRVTLLTKVIGQGSHRGKDSNDFLGVVLDVISFRTNLHHHVMDFRVNVLKPRVTIIELVA